MCEHLEIEEFGAYVLRRRGREETVTLMKCISCGKYLTLDLDIVPEESIVRKTSWSRENMRTVTIQLNSDIYERIQKLITEEGLEDNSKVINELVGLGLRNYHKILPKSHREQKG